MYRNLIQCLPPPSRRKSKLLPHPQEFRRAWLLRSPSPTSCPPLVSVPLTSHLPQFLSSPCPSLPHLHPHPRHFLKHHGCGCNRLQRRCGKWVRGGAEKDAHFITALKIPPATPTPVNSSPAHICTAPGHHLPHRSSAHPPRSRAAPCSAHFCHLPPLYPRITRSQAEQFNCRSVSLPPSARPERRAC